MNADTYDPEEVTIPLTTTATTASVVPDSGSADDASSDSDHRPFDCCDLARFSYRLTPTTVYPAWATDRKSCHIFDLDEIQSWWNSNCLVANMIKEPVVEEKLRCDPFRENEARKVAIEVQLEYQGPLAKLQTYGLSFM